MQFWKIWLSAVGLLLGFSTAADVEVPAWANQDPSEWVQDYPECGGEKQSPITLDQVNSTWKPSDPETKYEIKFENTDNKGKVYALNDGFFAIFNYTYPSESESSRVTLTYNGNSTTYYVHNANFRWPRDHVIPNKQSTLELHIYAENDKGEGIVFAYLLNNCTEPPCPTVCSEDNTVSLSSETAAALNMTNAGDEVTYEDNIAHLLPKNPGCDYFFYEGSFTVPPCREGTLWFVYKSVICVEDETVDAIRSLKDHDGELISSNERGIQERNGRRIIDLACDDEN